MPGSTYDCPDPHMIFWPKSSSAGDRSNGAQGVFLNNNKPLLALGASNLPVLWQNVALMIFFISLMVSSAIPFNCGLCREDLTCWILSENDYKFLLAILLDKTQEAIDPESCPAIVHWMKCILPRILKLPGNIAILNRFPKSLWQNDFDLRCRYLLYLKCRALCSADQP